jgi:hypothetical protein
VDVCDVPELLRRRQDVKYMIAFVTDAREDCDLMPVVCC